ncbi:hypothetical protein DSL72_003312 [Monilinia vaccinii-corymbosi]|uniref:Uncharacterized protein n=1 Tax=Monilinia vaccinii-corymbosi TaxID=61207 RepID=A0A8A3P8W3_9HELO|nr:hypothetical protein DSL72_003312 [Monilinia vaccinii-corymbosi]
MPNSSLQRWSRTAECQRGRDAYDGRIDVLESDHEYEVEEPGEDETDTARGATSVYSNFTNAAQAADSGNGHRRPRAPTPPPAYDDVHYRAAYREYPHRQHSSAHREHSRRQRSPSRREYEFPPRSQALLHSYSPVHQMGVFPPSSVLREIYLLRNLLPVDREHAFPSRSRAPPTYNTDNLVRRERQGSRAVDIPYRIVEATRATFPRDTWAETR